MKDPKPSGYTIWQDPCGSLIAVAVLNSGNVKTSNMIQVYILDSSRNPVQARKDGTDDTICGDCPLRSGQGCYVRVEHGPLIVWKAYHRGLYPVFDSSNRTHTDAFRGRAIRWGAYGDPAFIPYVTVAFFNSIADGWTGYTHQWQKCDPLYANVFMASIDRAIDTIVAEKKGYRWFRMETDHSRFTSEEVYCPATAEGGSKTHCITCGLCNGSRGPNDPRKNIVVKPHGIRKNLIQIGV